MTKSRIDDAIIKNIPASRNATKNEKTRIIKRRIRSRENHAEISDNRSYAEVERARNKIDSVNESFLNASA